MAQSISSGFTQLENGGFIEKTMENHHRNSGFTQLENGGSFQVIFCM